MATSAILKTKLAVARPDFQRLLWMLPEADRAVIAHRFGGEMTLDEIGATLNQSRSQVRETIRRSLALLRLRVNPALAIRKAC